LRANKIKIGIYKWILIEFNKSYVGFIVDWFQKLKKYYNLFYIEKEIKKTIVKQVFNLCIA
jgi:hypothetical protein